MKLPMTLLQKGTSAPVTTLTKGQGAMPTLFPRSPYALRNDNARY